MSKTARLWLLVVPPALAAGAGAFAITLRSDHQDVPRLTAVLVLLTGWSFIGAGLIARTTRPHNRTGLLLIGVGFGWFAGTPYAANDDLLWTIGVALSAVCGGFLIHLLLAYPTGSLISPAYRQSPNTVATDRGRHILSSMDVNRATHDRLA